MDINVLIAKYLDGESDPEEVDEISAWRSLSDENDLFFKQSEDAWRLAKSYRTPVHFDKERTWSGIAKRTKTTARQYTTSSLLRVAGIAASVALVIGCALSYIFTNGRRNAMIEQPQKITLYVPAGVSSKTVLPDGTVIWLNASSTLSYPSYFNGDTRTVELIGEAFFDVSRDENKPFIIQSGSLTVNVLGTSFNFKHYEEDSQAVLAVVTGTVTLSTDAVTNTKLPAGKYATVELRSLRTKVFDTPPSNSTGPNSETSPAKPEMTSGDANSDQFSSWRNNKMIFRDEPFVNVLNELSRRYNVEFEIRGDEIKHYEYTATFDNLSLEDVLNLLKMSSPINYSIQHVKTNTEQSYGKRKVTISQK